LQYGDVPNHTLSDKQAANNQDRVLPYKLFNQSETMWDSKRGLHWVFLHRTQGSHITFFRTLSFM